MAPIVLFVLLNRTTASLVEQKFFRPVAPGLMGVAVIT
jgi:hypothetical protein